ncbi:MAG TPA: hypothetical protein VE914_07760 [Candidatus Angelobacter sp.]|nr:hypothetical protein [Candidatus Angelobacter sp.]
MCPACLTTVALIAAGASSTGGLGAIVMRTLRGEGGGEIAGPRSEPEVEPGSTTEPSPATSSSLPASISQST